MAWLNDMAKSPQFKRAQEATRFTEDILDMVDDHMKRRGITREALSHDLGWEEGYLEMIFDGRHTMSIEDMCAIALGLKLKLSTVLREGGEET